LIAAALAIGVGAAALPVYLHASPWLSLPAVSAYGVVAALALRGRIVPALLAAPLLYAALFQIELPNLQALWIAPRVEALLRAQWPAWNAQGTGLAIAGFAEPSLMFLVGTDITILPDGEAAARLLANGAVDAAMVSDADAFAIEAGRFGMSVHGRGAVRGFNYSRGRWVTLTLFTR
jgi:hypothetical protein